MIVKAHDGKQKKYQQKRETDEAGDSSVGQCDERSLVQPEPLGAAVSGDAQKGRDADDWSDSRRLLPKTIHQNFLKKISLHIASVPAFSAVERLSTANNQHLGEWYPEQLVKMEPARQEAPLPGWCSLPTNSCWPARRKLAALGQDL